MRHVMAAIVVVAMATTIARSQPPVSIGLVREDGYLIPIATLTPDLFDTAIPRETFVHGERMPPPERPWKDVRWTLSYGAGKPKAEIKTLEPLTVDSHCVDQGVWRTTLVLPPARKNEAPVRKIGIAISGGAVEHAEDVAHQPDESSRRVVRHIVELTHAKERDRIATDFRDAESRKYLPPGHSPVERARVAVQLTQLRRHTAAGIATYYFEATKAWGPATDGGLVTGWIVETPSGLRDHDATYKFNDDGFKENDQAIVWGIVRHQKRALWILEWHGYEWEYYTVNDWPSGVELLKVDGGGC